MTTLAAVLPISIHLGIAPSRRRFLYAMINSSLAFFLFSFQVHEKSILLPLLPVSLLVLEEPVATTMFVNVAMFSMFPLLKREGLTLAYYLTTIMWNYLVGGYSLNTAFTTKIGTLVINGFLCMDNEGETNTKSLRAFTLSSSFGTLQRLSYSLLLICLIFTQLLMY